ncbi:hypothetical protein FRC06_002475 [Ceratobasidium sp. 370]|nr:hypothetical protein FRC06_002475 [Ceratobasidium sp. 370]
MSIAFVSGSGSLKKERCPMEFGSSWGEGKIFEWYRKLPSTAILRLQIRITGGAVPHRFVVAYMRDGSICRFDRRPLTASVGMLVVETAGEPSRRAADEASEVSTAEMAQIALSTRLEVDVNLDKEADLLLVLSACHAIAQDEKARNYALREYNCYFFSWTIVMLVMRHSHPFEIPSPEAVKARMISRLEAVTVSLTNKIVDALLFMVLDTITSFRKETGRRLFKGLSKRELAVWGLPVPVVRILVNQCLRLRLYFGLKEKLQDRVRALLQERTPPVLERVLASQGDVAEDVRKCLWLYELATVFQPTFTNQILHLLWDGLLDALAEGYGGMQPYNPAQSNRNRPLIHRLNYRWFLGNNVMQFSQIWNQALHAALPAAHLAGHGQYTPDKSHAEMFNLSFNAGCAKALEAAQAVVKRTGPMLDNPKRDAMWEVVWSVWEKVWHSTRVRAQDMVVTLIESTMEEMSAWASGDVVEELGNSQAQVINATIRFKKRQNAKASSLESFQRSIREFIQSIPVQTPEHRKNIEDAMARAWDISRETLGQPASVTPNDH